MAAFAKTSYSHASYAALRPTYPASLYNTVLSYHQGAKDLCLDLGCGHGLVARYLSSTFAQVLGTDPSRGMIEQAQTSTSAAEFPNVEFREASAESLPFIRDDSVDLVVAGQAAHWFDYPKLFPEMKRIVRKGGTLAFWGYKDHVFVDYPKATEVMNRYAYGKDKELLGSYWSQPGRSIVQNKLRDIQPPGSDWRDIRRVEYEPGTQGSRSGHGTLFMSKSMKIGEMKEYIRTWSSFHGWQEEHPGNKKRSEGGEGDVIDSMLEEIAEAEGWKQEDNIDEKEVEIEWGTGLLLARKQ
ncbi:MAG: hypothetical protein M1812_007584 [Candelaria pacifica]|nr:MAG: hypothetical protein M1812_007584 [Candelaria pacifica]